MTSAQIDNVNIHSHYVLITPNQLKRSLPLSNKHRATVQSGRDTIKSIIQRKDHRLLAIVGPCSIHDPISALEYAQNLQRLSVELSDTIYLVMRVYFEKPRTTTGWKGLINDPQLDNSHRIFEGLQIARKLLLDMVDKGVITASEALDPVSPQYLQDLMSWTAIGARTTESPTHREMASGLSSPVGFKNGTDGNLQVAINAMTSASHSHRFLGINEHGQVSVIRTKGNPVSHIVLRGGNNGSNYHSNNVQKCENRLTQAGLKPTIVIDCNHANSNKNPSLQPTIVEDIKQQIIDGNESIVGIMLESHLNYGNQPLSSSADDFKYGVSITDSCLDWERTEDCLLKLASNLNPVLKKRNKYTHIASAPA